MSPLLFYWYFKGLLTFFLLQIFIGLPLWCWIYQVDRDSHCRSPDVRQQKYPFLNIWNKLFFWQNILASFFVQMEQWFILIEMILYRFLAFFSSHMIVTLSQFWFLQKIFSCAQNACHTVGITPLFLVWVSEPFFFSNSRFFLLQ